MDGYHLTISGPDGEVVARMILDCEDDKEALRTAVSISSPYGHDLWHEERFIARFDPPWGEHLEAEPLE